LMIATGGEKEKNGKVLWWSVGMFGGWWHKISWWLWGSWVLKWQFVLVEEYKKKIFSKFEHKTRAIQLKTHQNSWRTFRHPPHCCSLNQNFPGEIS
jgi:hypothetical protein